jgi:uncharacterized peroxidase-related enzyme
MFLTPAEENDAARQLYESDREGLGFVMNLSRLWARRADFLSAFSNARALLTRHSSLAPRELAVLVCATAGNLGDSYCALAWGERLASQSDAAVAAAVLAGLPHAALTPREQALMDWTRKVVKHPNDTRPTDVEALRVAGLSDQEIFEATAFVAMRLAFSTVNDALGAAPDAELVERAQPKVRAAVSFGRRTLSGALCVPSTAMEGS